MTAVRLVNDYKKVHKYVSFNAMGFAITLNSAYALLDPGLKAALPDGLVRYVSIAVLFIGIVGRYFKIGKPEGESGNDDNTGTN